MYKLIVGIGLAALIATGAAAQQIAPVDVVASNTFSFFGEYKASNLIDGSGLSGGLHDNNYPNMWMTDLGVNQAQLTFDLGGVYTLSGVDLWNYNSGDPSQFQSTILRGVKDFRLLTSLDGLTFNEVFIDRLALGTGTDLAAQSFGFSSSARFVQIDILNNYGQGTYAERDWNSGLSEVRFNVAAVPEPGTWGMMLMGFGTIGFVMRRRRPGHQAMPQLA